MNSPAISPVFATLDAWKNPADAFRGKPFWCWNGKLTEEELLRQLPIFKEMGMSGVFMHSRTGLATEYLGDEWFNLINSCADAAEKLGLEAWLYDEDRWPSGSAGGTATQELRHRLKYLRLKLWPADTDFATVVWPESDYFVAAFSAKVDGLSLGHYTPLAVGGIPEKGHALLLFSWEHMAPHSFYNGGAYLDTMNRESTEHFLDLTHDRYAEKCGSRIGKSIPGIFTDEPHHGFVMCNNHGYEGPVETSWLTPWTPLLPSEFQKRFGADLIQKLPELFLQKNGERVSRVKWEYMELIQQLFLENWAKPMQDRCRKHGLILTGHVLHEDSLGGQTVPCGSMMRYYEYLDYPGVDVLSLDNRNFYVVKQLTSVARQLGKKWLLSELYGCTGWQMGFDGHKRIGDWQALYGINFRCHHLSWYSMAGESKRDYPASIFFQSSWYREYAQMETYFSRLHVLLQTGTPCCDVLVINPVESFWAQIYPGWATWLEAADAELKKLNDRYLELFTWLTEAQIDFDYGDEEHLARLGSVDGEVLQLGKMSYRTVIVSGMVTMRGTTLALLRRFREAGGNVIFVGTPPTYLNAEPSDKPARLGVESNACHSIENEVIAAIRKCGGVASEWECDADGLLSQIRRDGENHIVVMINPHAENTVTSVRCRLKNSGTVLELDSLRGDVYQVASESQDGWTEWETSFRPLQERVFLVGPALPDHAAHSARTELTFDGKKTLAGPFAYELDEPNICVLDFAAWRVAEGEWQDEIEILKVEEAVAERYQIPMRSGMMVQPWAASKQEKSATVPLRLRFSFDIEVLPEKVVDLLMESPGRFMVSVNGQPISIPTETGWFIDACFRRFPLPAGVFQLGRNEIELSCEYGAGVDLEAIYLLGQFGVALRGRQAQLTRLPDRLEVGDITTQGLPFYSGKLRYSLPTGNASSVRLPNVAAACVNFLSADGTTISEVPWAPFECALKPAAADTIIAELCLTRRNTFGPLHQVPIHQPYIGPDSYRSKGEQWSDDYQFFPAGLLADPEIA